MFLITKKDVVVSKVDVQQFFEIDASNMRAITLFVLQGYSILLMFDVVVYFYFK